MEFASFSWLGLKDKVFLDQCLDLLFGWYFGDVFSNIDEWAIEFQLVIE